jgi:hypothetical protein
MRSRGESLVGSEASICPYRDCKYPLTQSEVVMSSKARNAEKRKERAAESERLDQERGERDAYFSDVVSKLEELGLDAQKLKEYLDYL